MKKYIVSNTFETFGEPFPVECSTAQEAETEADHYAQDLAAGMYTETEDGQFSIPFYNGHGIGGYVHERRFHESLSDDSGANEEQDGKMSQDELISRIRDAAIEIEVNEE